MIKQFFNKEDKQIFECFANEKLDKNNFKYYYYHKIPSNFDFNRGFYVEQNEEWIMALEITTSNDNSNIIYIYSNSKDKDFFDNIFDFVNVKSSFHSIMGSHKIVSHILEKYPNDFEIFMDRVFYELNREDFNEVVDTYKDITLNFVDDGNKREVAQMLVDFSKEEWNGKNTKKYENCLEWVFHRNIAVFVHSNNVIGYGEVIGNSDMIGTIFIKNEYRNKGYGKLLTSLISQELLNHSEKLRVMTTNKNIAMKTILEKFGFKEYCKHLEIWKK